MRLNHQQIGSHPHDTWDPYRRLIFDVRFLLKFCNAPPILPHMVNPISSAHTSHASEAAKPAAPQSQPQRINPQPSDTVKLKSTGGVDHDSDIH
jgi:hypothetical protein